MCVCIHPHPHTHPRRQIRHMPRPQDFGRLEKDRQELMGLLGPGWTLVYNVKRKTFFGAVWANEASKIVHLTLLSAQYPGNFDCGKDAVKIAMSKGGAWIHVHYFTNAWSQVPTPKCPVCFDCESVTPIDPITHETTVTHEAHCDVCKPTQGSRTVSLTFPTRIGTMVRHLVKNKCCWQCGAHDGHLLKCSRCKIAYFCNMNCATIAWRSFHKAECVQTAG